MFKKHNPGCAVTNTFPPVVCRCYNSDGSYESMPGVEVTLEGISGTGCPSQNIYEIHCGDSTLTDTICTGLDVEIQYIVGTNSEFGNQFRKCTVIITTDCKKTGGDGSLVIKKIRTIDFFKGSVTLSTTCSCENTTVTRPMCGSLSLLNDTTVCIDNSVFPPASINCSQAFDCLVDVGAITVSVADI